MYNNRLLDRGSLIVNNSAIIAIIAYQKYLSPHKGFSCAHRLLHGGESCSQYIKRMIAERGVISAIPRARQRLKDCKAANIVMKAGSNKKRRQEKQNLVDDCVAGWDCYCCGACDAVDCLNGLNGDCGGGCDLVGW